VYRLTRDQRARLHLLAAHCEPYPRGDERIHVLCGHTGALVFRYDVDACPSCGWAIRFIAKS
jgi:hypothetical protein